jgi:hypothetical protein
MDSDSLWQPEVWLHTVQLYNHLDRTNINKQRAALLLDQ